VVRDALSYLRAVANPPDTLSLSRVINTPTRGIGQATLAQLTARAAELAKPLGEAILQRECHAGLPDKAAAATSNFARMLHRWRELARQSFPPEKLLHTVLEESGYRRWILESWEEEEKAEGIEHLEEGTVQQRSQHRIAAIEHVPEDGLGLVELPAHAGVLGALAGEQKGQLGTLAASGRGLQVFERAAQVLDGRGAHRGAVFEVPAGGVGGVAEICQRQGATGVGLGQRAQSLGALGGEGEDMRHARGLGVGLGPQGGLLHHHVGVGPAGPEGAHTRQPPLVGR
jgi:hypothetical protein